MLKKLRVKFVCINMLLVTAMLAVIFGLVLYFTARNLESASIQTMRSMAAAPMKPGRPGEAGTGTPCFVLETGPRGEVAVTGGGFYDLSDEAFLLELIRTVFAQGEQVGVLEDYGLRYCLLEGPGRRAVFADMSGEREALASLARSCGAAGGAAFLLFLAVSLALARWAVKPVEEAWTRQRQFVADASHELKTPLTVILTNGELLQDPAYGEEDRARFSGHVLTMARQMRGLVESLLELARVDAGVVSAAMHLLDFSQLVSDGALPFEPVCFEAGLELACRIEEGIRVRGSEAHLRQVLEILLDNAIKYSARPAAVTLELRRQGARCLLSVSNPGEPIGEEDLRNIFQRFYRVDKARGMDRSYGLGLAIAEEIVKNHRGRIWAESAGGLNTFYVELAAVR